MRLRGKALAGIWRRSVCRGVCCMGIKRDFEVIRVARSLVAAATRELAHQMDPKSADLGFFKRAGLLRGCLL